MVIELLHRYRKRIMQQEKEEYYSTIFTEHVPQTSSRAQSEEPSPAGNRSVASHMNSEHRLTHSSTYSSQPLTQSIDPISTPEHLPSMASQVQSHPSRNESQPSQVNSQPSQINTQPSQVGSQTPQAGPQPSQIRLQPATAIDVRDITIRTIDGGVVNVRRRYLDILEKMVDMETQLIQLEQKYNM